MVREGSVSKFTEVRPHTSEQWPQELNTLQNDKAAETEGKINDETKYSTSVDPPQLDKCDELESRETHQNDTVLVMVETDTPATITANANNPESFSTLLPQQQVNNSMEDTGPYTEELDTPQNHTKSLVTTEPPVLSKIIKDAVYSNVSSDEDEDNVQSNTTNNDKRKRHRQKSNSYDIAVSSEVQDQAAMQIMNFQMPTQPATEGLCTGITQCSIVKSPHDPSKGTVVTVLWVNPHGSLVCINTESVIYIVLKGFIFERGIYMLAI